MFKANKLLTRAALATLLAGSFVFLPTTQIAFAADGDSDTALLLNGTNQYLEVTDPGTSPFDTTGLLTLQAWVYPTTSCTSQQTVANKVLSYLLYCVNGSWAYAFSANGTTWTGATTNIKVEANAWHHVAISRNTSTSNVKIYYDGINVETLTAQVPTTLTPNNQPFRVGRELSGNYFQGSIDEVRFYNTQRSDAQIKSDMNTWGPADTTGLVAYYDFNDVSGSTVTNKISSPGANTTLTAYSSPTYSNVESATVVNGDNVITFPRSYLAANGGWKIPNHVSSLKSLVIAGGGGGGSRAGGGGGAGGYVYDAALAVTPNSYQAIVVGQGGSGWSYLPGYNGSNSSLGSLRTALGGGGGGHADGANNVTRDGRSGGSGGGAGGNHFSAGTSASIGTSTQFSTYGYGLGNNGGTGYSAGAWPSGGGGGANSAGGNANGPANTAGKGGAGITDPIGGTSICYATGGGGGVLAGYTKGEGGDCGGTASPNNNAGLAGSSSRGAPAAKANTGSGGAGDGYNASGADYEGGNGASGVIVLRYAIFSDVSLTFSGGTVGAFRSAGTITATANLAGRVTFYERGKVIPGCKNRPTNGSLIATCTWRPSTRGNVSITATNRPTNSYISNASTSLSVFVTTRSGART